MKYIRSIASTISQLLYDVFVVTLTGYMICLAIESVKPGVVVRYVNLNDLLIVTAVFGFFALLLPHPIAVSYQKKWYYVGVTLISLTIAFAVFQMMASLGVWAYLSAVAIALLVGSVGIILQTDSTV